MKAKDVRKGNVVMFKNAPHKVMDFQHRTPGNLRAFVQIKFRNILNGVTVEDRFSSDDDLPSADIYTYSATYLYSDGDGHHFMNSENYDQVALTEELVGDSKLYLMEGMTVELSTFEDRPIGIVLPKTVVLEIVETTPELRGATASNSPKPATTNTGLVLSVPPFIKIGEKVVVDTEDGSYLSRAD
jgi:elongation factor P